MKRLTPMWPNYVLAVGLAFLYNDWLFGFILNPHISANRSLISELSALNQPYHWVFQLLDIAAGVITIVCATYIWHFSAKISLQKRWLLTGLFLCIGLDSIIDASLPIACAPSVNAQCSLLATHSILTAAHLIESNIAGVAIAAAPVVWWWWHHSDKHRHIAKASLWLVTLESAIGIAAIIIRIAGFENYGGIQRLYQLGIGIWIGMVVHTAIKVHVESRTTMKIAESDDVPAVS